ncbi:MAG: toll/interleukin-1 receptor domain-containing protein [Oscillospiraceae bacterium]|nr:toll/interleukin-1 receptor domain-containing protein [Oscillospiraceae bacterium]
MSETGGLVFISHSHQDIDIVRRIRNRFELHGFEPLVFYLKCLSDEDEIEELIKREIAEREWFVFVDSEHSRRSAWVRTECEYICGFSDKKLFTLKADDDVEKQVDSIARRLQVYISFTVSDLQLAKTVKQYLTAHDYRAVIAVEELSCGVDFATTMQRSLKAAAESGFMLLLVTEAAPQSALMHREIAMIKRYGGEVIPVYVGDGALNKKQLKALGEHSPLHVDSLDEAAMAMLLSEIERRIGCHRSNDFDMSVFG